MNPCLYRLNEPVRAENFDVSLILLTQIQATLVMITVYIIV